MFLPTFVMIGQNRQASFQQAKLVHQLTTEIHMRLVLAADGTR